MMNKNITSIPVFVWGTNHSNTLGLVRSLGEKKIKVHTVLIGTLPQGLVYDSKYPTSVEMFSTLELCFNHLVSKVSSLHAPQKPLLLSTTDFISSYVDQHSDELSNFFYIEHAGKQGRHTELMNKLIIGRLAEECGLKIPRTVVVNKKDNSIENVNYPCFTKSFASINGGKKEECVCNNVEELQTVLSQYDGESLLVQQYINKKTEYCLQGFSANGTVFIPYVMMYLRFSDNAFGGYVKMFRLRDEGLKSKCEQLIRKSNYEGLFSIEFLVDVNDELYFTEVNLRNDGYSYFTTSGGANLPYLYYLHRLGYKFDLSSLKLKESFTAMNEGYDYKQSVSTKKISKIQYLKDLIGCKSYIVFNWKDWPFFIKKIQNKIFR